jgi:anti-sigma B factor antagonist
VTERCRDRYRGFAVGVLAADRCDRHRARSGGMRLRSSGLPERTGLGPAAPAVRDAVGLAAPLPGRGNVTTTFLADDNPCLADTRRASWKAVHGGSHPGSGHAEHATYLVVRLRAHHLAVHADDRRWCSSYGGCDAVLPRPRTLGELLGDRDVRSCSLGGTAKAGGWLMNGGTDSTVPDLLSIAIAEPAPRVIVAHVRGELDMSSAPELENVLGPLLVGPLPRRLVLDLTELRFLGSHGVAALIRLHNQTATAAGPTVLRLAGLRPPVVRVLTLTAALALFDLHDNVEDALAAVYT